MQTYDVPRVDPRIAEIVSDPEQFFRKARVRVRVTVQPERPRRRTAQQRRWSLKSVALYRH
jgi:hypothetical protein